MTSDPDTNPDSDDKNRDNGSHVSNSDNDNNEDDATLEDKVDETFGSGAFDELMDDIKGSRGNWDTPSGVAPSPSNSNLTIRPDLNDFDRLVLGYNNRGLSGRKIAKVLFDSHNIEVADKTVTRHLRDIQWRYPGLVKINYKFTARSKPKSSFRWYKVIERLKIEIESYTSQMGFKPSSRTMAYQLEDLGIITPKDIVTFSKVTVKARLRYTDSNNERSYPILPIDCFAEDDQRKTEDNYDGSKESKDAVAGEIKDPIENIESMIKDLKEAARKYEGKPEGTQNSEMGGRWYGQPKYVEIWEEKNDLMPGFLKILGDRNVRIRANKGFASLDYLRQCVLELKEEIIEGLGIKPENIYILYCGDWDPSGYAMDYYMRKRVRQLGLPDVIADNFERIAVTRKQIDKYNLPLMALDEGNSNTKEFKRLHGEKATHLNAFFTQAHFEAFKKILLAAVDKHWDQKIYDEMKKEYDNIEPENEPEPYTEEQLKEKREQIYRKITAAFTRGWYTGYTDAPYYW